MLGFFKKKPASAHMGGENTIFYDEKRKRWVERGKEDEKDEDDMPPPPPTSQSTQATRHVDRADPASRYVVAGGFGRSTVDASPKSFSTPPKLPSAPPTGGFFVPTAVQKSEAAIPESASPKKYKGFSIPKFEKPEGYEGTEETYTATEIQKWKEKIDKREARKKGAKMENGENGIKGHDRMRSGKLDDAWSEEKRENGFEEDDRSGVETEEAAWNVPYGYPTEGYTSAPPEMGLGMDRPTAVSGGEDTPVALFPVQSSQLLGAGEGVTEQHGTVDRSEIGHVLHREEAVEQSHHPYLSIDDDVQTDFDAWGNPEENERLAQEMHHQQDIPEATQLSSEPAYEEAEYPGAIRSSEDPCDVAWSMNIDWMSNDQRYELTSYMYQSYQDVWRSWHKDGSEWEGFWAWYYDGGFDLIHQQQVLPSDPQPEAVPSQSGDAAAFFDAGLDRDQPTETGSVPWAASMEPASEMPTVSDPVDVPSPEEGARTNTEDAFMEQTLPTNLNPIIDSCQDIQPTQVETKLPREEDLLPDAEDNIHPQDFRSSEDQHPVVDHSVVSPAVPVDSDIVDTSKEIKTSYPVSVGKASSKLTPWDDPCLLSLPDLWNEATSSDDETDDGKLPFAVFGHDGMLQFLQRLLVLLNGLSMDGGDVSKDLVQFRRQVTELIKAVESSSQHRPSNASNGLLLEQLEQKDKELTSLQHRLHAVEDDRRSTEAASIHMKQSYQSMEDRLKRQEIDIQDLTDQLSRTTSALEENKNHLQEALTQLEEKNAMLAESEASLATERNKIDDLCRQLAVKEATPPEEFADFKDETVRQTDASTDEVASRQLPDGDALGGPVEEMVSEGSLAAYERENAMLQKELTQMEENLKRKEAEFCSAMTDHEAASMEDRSDALMEQLEAKESLLLELKRVLQDQQSTVNALQSALEQKTSELASLRNKENDVDLGSELEQMEQKFARLESELHDKESEFEHLSSMLDTLDKKDALISKLSAALGEKDRELLHLRSIIEDGHRRQGELVEKLSAKDHDLENVVMSLLFSQKQVSVLGGYCEELGGDPVTILASVAVE